MFHEFNRCSYDCYVYFKQLTNDKYIYILLYVDDMLIACKKKIEIDSLKRLWSFAFDMKDLRRARKILGMEIIQKRSEGSILLSQEKYIRRAQESFDIIDCKSVQLPLAAYFRLYNLYCPN